MIFWKNELLTQTSQNDHRESESSNFGESTQLGESQGASWALRASNGLQQPPAQSEEKRERDTRPPIYIQPIVQISS